MKNERLDRFRKVGDPVSDQIVEDMILNHQKMELYQVLANKSWSELDFDDVSHSGLRSFLSENNELPIWANPDKMKAASALFRSNGNEFLFMLGIVSLPYCYAAARGALSLYHTEKIRKNTELRLLDTSAFILQVMTADAFEEGGDGFFAVKQIRLRHSLARYFLSRIPEIKALGEMPINQEDMAGTNLAFSYIALMALPKIGVKFPLAEKENYIHLWAVIGSLMGLNQDLIPMTMKEAYHLELDISTRQFYSSSEGRDLTDQLIDHYKENIPNKATVALIRPLIKYMVGDKVARIIGLHNKITIFSVEKLMYLLPVFKHLIFPPVQSFETIVNQIEVRRRQTQADHS